jgi:hypothetical protein
MNASVSLFDVITALTDLRWQAQHGPARSESESPFRPATS